MFLVLAQGTKPLGLEVKTGMPGTLPDVRLGDYEISMSDFCEAVLYVLTNTNLEPNDPRLYLVEKIKSMKEVESYNGRGKRLM
jgi:hypothetical protein